MPKNYSAAYMETVRRTSADEAPLILLDITHPGLTEPARVVNDTADVVSFGNTYTALAFDIALPDDPEEGLPRAMLAIDNVGRVLTQWIESSNGGRGAKVRIMQILRSNPNVIEWEVTLDLSNVRLDAQRITGTLSYEDLLNRPAVMLWYRPETAPGIF